MFDRGAYEETLKKILYLNKSGESFLVNLTFQIPSHNVEQTSLGTDTDLFWNTSWGHQHIKITSAKTYIMFCYLTIFPCFKSWTSLLLIILYVLLHTSQYISHLWMKFIILIEKVKGNPTFYYCKAGHLSLSLVMAYFQLHLKYRKYSTAASIMIFKQKQYAPKLLTSFKVT